MRKKLLISSFIFLMGFFIVNLFADNNYTTADSIVAIVNNKIITSYDIQLKERMLLGYLKSQGFEGKELQKKFEENKKNILQGLIDEKLLLSRAEELGLEVKNDLELYIENIKKENNLKSDKELRNALLKQGINYEEWKKQLENQILQQKLIQHEMGDKVKVENRELLDYYNNHKDEFKEEAVYTLQAIFISNERPNTEEIKKKIKELLKKEEFTKVAEEYSDEPLKKLKGELGVFKESELAKEILSVVKNLKKGEISDWIAYKNGWLIVKLSDFSPEKIPEFKEIQEKIRQKLFFEKRQEFLKEYIKKLRKEAYIKIIKK